MNSRNRLFATIGLFLVLGLASVHAQPSGDKEKAQKLLSQGNDLLAEGNNEAALAAFEAAYEAYPSPSLLLNIGTTLRALGRNADAANAYARWIHAKQNPERLAEVEEVLTELDQKVAGISIETATGATVEIDGEAIAASALGDIIRLEPGKHVIVARKVGYDSARREIELSAGSRETMKLPLLKATASDDDDDDDDDASITTPDPELDQPSSGSSGMRIAGLSIAGLGLASVAAGVYFGLDARSISNELDEEGERLTMAGEPWTAELLAREKDGESAQTRMIVFSAVGAAAIVGGGVLYVLGRSSGNETNRDLAFAPTVTPDGVGWAISGSF